MLTEVQVRQAKPRPDGKRDKLRDGRSLWLVVEPDGSKWWLFRFAFYGKETSLSLGTYPEIGLKIARQKREEARADLARGVNPSAKRRAEKVARVNTFEAIGREWLERGCGKKAAWKATTKEQLTQRLESYAFPHIGSWPIQDIKPADVLDLLRRIEARGTHETAHRVKTVIGQVFRHAVATRRVERDPTADLRDALKPTSTQHFAAVTKPGMTRKQSEIAIGGLLRAIDGYQGQPAVMIALRLLPHVFTRPGELRSAEWSEIDIENAEWRIPASKMKMNRPHVVPLSRQALVIIEELRSHTGTGRFLFPGLRSAERPISNNTLCASLKRLGYGHDDQTAHGFRTIASSWLHEAGENTELIELQLRTQTGTESAESTTTRIESKNGGS